MPHVDSPLRPKPKGDTEPSNLAKRFSANSDWRACEDALRELDHGVATIHALGDAATQSDPVDTDQLGRALYFLAGAIDRHIDDLKEALGMHAGDKEVDNV